MQIYTTSEGIHQHAQSCDFETSPNSVSWINSTDKWVKSLRECHFWLETSNNFKNVAGSDVFLVDQILKLKKVTKTSDISDECKPWKMYISNIASYCLVVLFLKCKRPNSHFRQLLYNVIEICVCFLCDFYGIAWCYSLWIDAMFNLWGLVRLLWLYCRKSEYYNALFQPKSPQVSSDGTLVWHLCYMVS